MKFYNAQSLLWSYGTSAYQLLANRSCRFLLSVSVVLLLLAGCPNTSDSLNDEGNAESEFSGTVLKGPFQAGSSVSLHELHGSTLDQTGVSFPGEIANEAGGYNISARTRPGLIEVTATGQFFHEVSGVVTTGDEPLTLTALTENPGRVNVNLLTTIEGDRVRRLVSEEGLSFSNAKEQALNEIFDFFGAVPGVADSTQIELESEDGKILLMLSSIIATAEDGEARSVDDIKDLLTDIRTQFADGMPSELELLQILESSAGLVNHELIRDNLSDHYESIDIGSIGAGYDIPSFSSDLTDFSSQLAEFSSELADMIEAISNFGQLVDGP